MIAYISIKMHIRK